VNRRLTEALVFGFLMPHRAETPKTRSQRHLARIATPVLLSNQLHQGSSRVPEAWLGALNPQVRAPHGGFCSGSLKQAPAGAARSTGSLA
jgi:hypothetical protein